MSILDFDDNDLPLMPPLEGEEEVKLEPEKTIAERLKLNPRKRKIVGTRLKILTPNKLLTRLTLLRAQIKFASNPCKIHKKLDQTNTISFVST